MKLNVLNAIYLHYLSIYYQSTIMKNNETNAHAITQQIFLLNVTRQCKILLRNRTTTL